MNVLIIMGHPRKESFCADLANAYRQGVDQAALSVRTLILADLAFDPNVREDSPENQALEPDLERARDLLAWAQHLVFVYPTWWGTMPALLKGFLDRMVMPGTAFHFYGPGATEWQGLWSDKTAQLITTMDTPPLIYRLIYKAPGNHAMANATLGFCGVKPVRTLVCGSIRTSTAEQRMAWLERARRAGFRLRTGVRSRWGRAAHGVQNWFKALRLQFYPMSWAAYTIGALTAAHAAGLDTAVYGWGYLCLFCLEAATVFSNDYFDYETDRINRLFGPFTGGSRVLVDGSLSFPALRQGIAVALALAFVGGALALRASGAPPAGLAWLMVAAVLTLGYTVPPLRLCYRGLGEIDVAFTHSALVMVIGYVLQGGVPGHVLPWLLSLPLFFAILPAIILAGVPDRLADATVSKHTVAERFGVSAAIAAAAVAVLLAALMGVVFDGARLAGGLYAGVSYFVLPHAALCLTLLHRQWQIERAGPAAGKRIDLLLFVTLNYMVWFIAVPYYHLLT